MNYGKRGTKKRIKSVSSKSQKRSSRFYRGILKFVALLCGVGMIAGVSLGFGMVKGMIDNTPQIDISNIVPKAYASTVYDGTGKVTDTLVMEGSNREAATYDELPKDLVNAFVAIEDARFWEHNGIDLRAILRAAKGVLTGKTSGGGSTLTQQLIKNNVFNGGREKSFGEKLERKVQEQYLAIQLESSMSKELIITNYLNTINLGSNALGVKVAARRYFDKEVSDLTLSESAVLAGITQNPTRLNPITGREKNEEKRKVILQYMLDQGYITKEQQEEALADDVYARIDNVNIVNKETTTAYSYFTDELISQVKDALMTQLGYNDTQAHNMIYSGGLSIYTTQDPALQAIVDEEVNNPENYPAARYSMEYRLSITHGGGTTEHFSEESIKGYHKEVLNDSGFDGLYDNEEQIQAEIDQYKAYLLKEDDQIIGERVIKTLQPQVSFVLLEQKTGQVKAISGGRGEKTDSLTLNRATNTKRQPGSTFKVITAFAPAIDKAGATLGTVYYDTEYTVGKKTFANWYGNKGYLGYSNIRDGITYSMNIVAVRCMMETVTPQLGVEYAKNFGITTLTDTDVNAATALGGITDGVTNLELTGAFASIANGGIYNKPIFFTKIVDHDGKVLISNESETHRVLKDSTAYLITSAMESAMQSGRKYARAGMNVNPTGVSASIPNMSIAGKSGTTTSDVDAWFEGFTPYYTAGIWAGYDNNQRLAGKNGNASFHKAMYKKIMTRVHEGMSDPGFGAPPASVEAVEICRKSGKLPIPDVCSNDPRGSTVYTEYFERGTAPTDFCNNHIQATVCQESNQLATDFCPNKVPGIFVNVPADSGETDDSFFALPQYCTIHTAGATIIEDNTDAPGDVEGPGGGQSNPIISGPPGVDAPISNSPTSEASQIAPHP